MNKMDSGDIVDLAVQEVISDFNKKYDHQNSDTHFVKNLRLIGLSDKQIALVILVYESTCPACMGTKPCYCQNDE